MLDFKKIVLIGAYPPPVGGVSIHIHRLISLLSDVAFFDVVDESAIIKKEWPFNLRSLNLLKYLRIVRQADIVHVHSGLFIRRLFHILICRFLLKKYVVVTIHHSPSVESFTSVTKWLLSKCNHAILVNQEGYDMMFTPSKCEYHVIPAFLPPIVADEPELPNTVEEWLEKKRQNNYVICISNAWRLVVNDGVDLYGLDICIEAFRELKKMGCRCCIIFVVASNPSQSSLMEVYKQRINEYGLENDFLIWEQPLSFVRLILESDIVLRTTNTDGDALSIREALYFDKTVIASDVVKRPNGVKLFENRDVISLVGAIRDNCIKGHCRANNVQKNYTSSYINIYRLQNHFEHDSQ